MAAAALMALCGGALRRQPQMSIIREMLEELRLRKRRGALVRQLPPRPSPDSSQSPGTCSIVSLA